MSLKSLMQYLGKQAAVTPVTPEKITGLQPEPAWIGRVPRVTPVTLHLDDARENVLPGQFGEAVNDPAAPALESQPSAQPPELVQPPAPALDKHAKPRKQTFMEWQDTWLHLDRAYQAHHFNCPTCIAAGWGNGQRCQTGFVLWKAYSDASCE